MKVTNFQPSVVQPLSSRDAYPRSRPIAGGQSGVALVVTLILLAVITFMAIAFLVLSHREQSSVATTTDQALARQAADAATERAIADLAVAIVSSGNPNKVGYSVSTTYLNPWGFSQNVVSPTNVNYEAAAAIGPAQQLVNLQNLLYTPRPPVFITNRVGGSNEFRYYLDLNRNGMFDPSGWITNIDQQGLPLTDASNRPLLTQAVGDPQWVGGTESADKAHSGDNRFIWRYAYAVVPISETLDINYIHNQAIQLNKTQPLDPSGQYFFRNQGVGTWELNLASFLYDLNTNTYAWGGRYVYQPPAVAATGNAFSDACSILANRYANLQYDRALKPVSGPPLVGLFYNGRSAFESDGIDGYTAGPLMTNTTYRTDPDLIGTRVNQPWVGADNTNHFFSPQDLFDPSRTSRNFTNVLLTVARQTNTYDRYTFSRLVSTLGTDSAPEPPGKINLNYDNLVLTNAQGVASTTNFYPWDATAFFTNTAAKLLADAGYKFSITNIQVWPTNYYTPAVHRLLQLAANIYDSTANRVFGSAGGNSAFPYCPTVFRPIIRRLVSGEIVIATFREVTQHLPWLDTNLVLTLDLRTSATNSPVILPYVRDPVPNDRSEVMVAGVPLVIGAKKGLPNFNEFAMQTHLYVSRLLEFRRDPTQPASTSPIQQTNQMYVVSLTNNFAVEAWNPYTNAYLRPLRLQVEVNMSAAVTNEFGNFVVNTNVRRFIDAPLPAGSWKGWSGGNPVLSFIRPLTNQFAFLPNSTYTNGAPGGFRPQTHIFERNSGFYVPRWMMSLNTKVKFILYDTEAQRIVDYVNLSNSEQPIDIFGKLAEGSDCSTISQTSYRNAGNLWCTNRLRSSVDPMVPTYGILNQIMACLNGNEEEWRSFTMDPTAGQDVYKAVDFFRANLGLSPRFNTGTTFNKSNVFYAPFSPYRPIYTHTTWQANDPLVHYTLGDLIDESIEQTNRVDFASRNPPLDNIGLINTRYEPWGGNPAGARSNPDIPIFQIAAKDPMVMRPDDWDFPTNKYANVGWLGRVHRGTPWQTIFLKSTNVLFQTGFTQQEAVKNLLAWQKWTGNRQAYVNSNRVDTAMYSNNAVVIDAVFSLPTNDWRLMDLFTTAFNDNASRGRLSVNQTNLAAWSAVLGGVNVLQSSTTSTFIEPAGVYDPMNPTPLVRVVDGINAMRAMTPTGSFQKLGDVLATPQLTIASPYITNATAISDAVVERIPQQIMGLLRGGEQPRFLVYSYGQALKPAPRSVQTGGTYAGLCTNYTITAEVATRAVLRMEGPAHKPHAVVESFNVLPPD